MTAPPCTTEGCDGFCHDQAYICSRCSSKLERALTELPALIAELEVTATRQAVIGSGDGGRRSAERPLPFHWNAADLYWCAHNTLSTWVRVIEEGTGDELTPPPPEIGPTCRSCAHPLCYRIRRARRGIVDDAVLTNYLIPRLYWLRRRREATEAYDEITSLLRTVSRTVDRLAERWYAGKCECGLDLYARVTADIVRCSTCGNEWDAEHRRNWLLLKAEDRWENAATIARALTSLQWEVTPDRIYKWAERRRIFPRGKDENGRPTYRVGDVMAILRADAVRAAEKTGAVL